MHIIMDKGFKFGISMFWEVCFGNHCVNKPQWLFLTGDI